MEKQEMKISLSKLLLLLFFYVNNAHGQHCLADFYGNWKSKNGSFINLMGDIYGYPRIVESTIGNDTLSMQGIFSYSKLVLSVDVEIIYDKQNGKPKLFEKDLEFSVINVDFQRLILKPISRDAEHMFGANEITFFNENFVEFDSFRLDSLRYTYLHAPFELEINRNGEMRKKKIISYKSNYWRWYTRKLTEREQVDLKKMIFHSQIITMSKCGLLGRSCADCRPAQILIVNNGNTTYYYGDGIDKNIEQLEVFLNNLVVKPKWKKIKKDKKRKR